MASRNPFAPTFGASPPVLVGRDSVLADIDEALETGPTHPDYTTLLTGVRGSGKTSLLNAIEDLAHTKGWRTVSVDASTHGLLDRLTAAATRLLADLTEPPPTTRVTGVKVMGSGIDLDRDPPPDEPTMDLRELLEHIADLLAIDETGLLVTIDELHSAPVDEVRAFGAVIQHVTRREGRSVAFVGAALPEIEATLLRGSAATFLQRCARSEISRIEPTDVARALEEPIREHGGSIAPTPLARAVAATSGYAFMIQLVGFYSWKASADPTRGIGAADVDKGIAEAQKRIGHLVLGPTWATLSEVDHRVLRAMAVDDGPSTIAGLTERLGVPANYLSVYRSRLIKAGMVVAAGRGKLEFAHHATREWIRAMQ